MKYLKIFLLLTKCHNNCQIIQEGQQVEKVQVLRKKAGKHLFQKISKKKPKKLFIWPWKKKFLTGISMM